MQPCTINMTTSCACIPVSGATGDVKRRSPELTAALTTTLFTLARAALLHGLPDLATALEVSHQHGGDRQQWRG